ncbi:aminomethyltransferase [Paenibacillus sp. V4I5]|nr:aminomethyltransferase [Paenibacillus sp. V4I5]
MFVLHTFCSFLHFLPYILGKIAMSTIEGEVTSMLKRTPLFPIYTEHGARVIDFGGWELPVQFAGIQKEHDAVRQQAGLFDVSHMGEVRISGEDALPFLQKLTTNDVSKLEAGQCQYSLMCYPTGGVVDDLLVYKLGDNNYMLVINASNIDKDLEWMQQNLTGKVDLTNISEETAMLAMQGPHAELILAKLTEAPIQSLKTFRFLSDVEVAGINTLLSRTGYTGEDGFELYVDQKDAVKLWKLLLGAGQEHGLVPAGLGARDTLRFEARLPLYGQELSKDITPLEAGLSFFVKLDKGDFIGRDVIAGQKTNGTPRKLVGIEMVERGIPRPHYAVFNTDGKQIGEVTTGTQSPTFKTNVGLALIDSAYSTLGTELNVEIRGSQVKAKVVATPFYKRKP